MYRILRRANKHLLSIPRMITLSLVCFAGVLQMQGNIHVGNGTTAYYFKSCRTDIYLFYINIYISFIGIDYAISVRNRN